MNRATQDKIYYLNNRDRIDARKKLWRANNPATVKARRREQTLRTYGLTVQGYNEMLGGQDSGCKLCGYSPDDYLVVDHCHNTGKVRGLLCDPCNKALGLMRDNPYVLRNGAGYLELSNN